MSIQVTCHWCSKVFRKFPKDIKRTKKFHFCSRDCYNAWQRDNNKKTCHFCGKIFYKGRKNQMYCSLECMHKADRGGTYTVNCKVCNAEFTTYRSNKKKTCSQKCLNILKSQPRKKHVKVICKFCGDAISLTETMAKERKFCSDECKKKYKYRKQPVFITCKNCNKKFRIYPSRKGITVFCSRNCQREYEASKHITKICPECNKEFEIIPSREYFIYCSQECYLNRLRRGGESHVSWKGGCAYYYGPNWQTQSEKARKRDNYTCQSCGKHQNDNYRDLDVHHIKRFQEFGLKNYKKANLLSNLITLCPSCHNKIESGKITI